MKVRNFIVIAALAFSLQLNAQESDTRKNMAKVNVSSFAVKGFGLQYERQVGSRVTVALGYSSVPTSTLPFKGYLNNQINNPNVNIDQFKLGTSVITPEVRYYFGTDGAFHGFYIAPYARFGTYNIAGPVSYTTSTKQVRTAVFDGKIKMASGGFMLGSNFKLSEKLYLDWWIAGGSYGTARGSVHAATNLSPDEQIGLKNELDRVKVPFTTLESEVNSQGATVTSVGNMIGVRGLGINLGFRF